MKRLFIVLLVFLMTASASHAFAQAGARTRPSAAKNSTTEKEEWQKLQNRFKEHWPRMSGWSWSLIHSYASETEMEAALRLFEKILVALASENPSSIRDFTGPQGLNDQLVKLMSSKDETVSGFAASVLAVIGDLSYAPQIAALLDRKPTSRDYGTVRGRAAEALGLLGAKQYKRRIATLLRSKSFYDRVGAARALALFKAVEYADDIARLIQDRKDFGALDDSSLIDCLFDMGVAANYKTEIAKILDDEIPGDRTITAAYALARLEATEHAPRIAKLLSNKYQKGDAAKALALLGTREYVPAIVPMLEDEDSSNREDAVLALAILGAKDQVPAIAKLLKDEKVWVQREAALALVLLEANEYADDALPIIARQTSGSYFDVDDFNPVVAKEASDLDLRFRSLLMRMKDHNRKSGSK